ncbi:hypothetical protein ACFQ78_41265 [Streptomyces sp. NPDC056519]|uniref:hypothetical protein n=1 Tax=Streptomyces sp. NPDC056519 TaxID=3345849 RepID=UPI0036CC11BE
MTRIIIIGKFETEGNEEKDLFRLPKNISVNFWRDHGAGLPVPTSEATQHIGSLRETMYSAGRVKDAGTKSANPTISSDDMLLDVHIAYWRDLEGCTVLLPGHDGLDRQVSLRDALAHIADRLSDADEVHWVSCTSFHHAAPAHADWSAAPDVAEEPQSHQVANVEQKVTDVGQRVADVEQDVHSRPKTRWEDDEEHIQVYMNTSIREGNNEAIKLSMRLRSRCHYRIANGRIIISAQAISATVDLAYCDRYQIDNLAAGSFVAKRTTEGLEISDVSPPDHHEILTGLDWMLALGSIPLFRKESGTNSTAAGVCQRTREILKERHNREMKWCLIGTDRLFVFTETDTISTLYGPDCAAYVSQKHWDTSPTGTIKFHQGGMINQPRAWLTGVPVDRKSAIKDALHGLITQISFRDK